MTPASALVTLLAMVLAAGDGVAPQPPASPEVPRPATTAAPAPQAERWVGVIQVGGGTLEFALLWAPGDAAASTLSIAAQGVKDAALLDCAAEGDAMRFTLAPPGAPKEAHARFTLTRAADGRSASGTLAQSGLTLPVEMRRVQEGAAAGPRRPQTPTPPFPYATHEVAFENPADGARLAGTLCVPPGPGPFPAAVLITGSGPQDRDETLFSHKPFLVIADHLARRGIATLRYDDRGVGGSAAAPGKAQPTTLDFAADVRAALALLRSRAEIDPAGLGLIGHSEGGLVASIVAAEDPALDFVVLLAAPGLPGAEVLRGQVAALAKAAGADDAFVARQEREHQAVMALLATGAPEAELRAALLRLVRAQMGEDPDSPAPPQAAARHETVVAANLPSLQAPWFRTFLALDPRPHLAKVESRVLVLNGALDTQVLASENVPAIERALRARPGARVAAHVLPGLNHLFQPARSGGPAEYAAIETTIDPPVLDLIADWIVAKP